MNGRQIEYRRPSAFGARPSACDPSAWLHRSRNNTGPLLLVVDDWLNTGLGHQVEGYSAWLALMLRSHTRRALAFAPCVPSQLRAKFTPAGESVVAECESPVFSFADHFTFDGLGSLRRAVASEFEAAHVVASNTTLLSVLADSDKAVVAVVRPLREAVRSLRQLSGGSRLAHVPCLRRLRPIRLLDAPPHCDVGLHLRTLLLDDPRCEAFSKHDADTDGCPGHLLGRIKRHQRSHHCRAHGKPHSVSTAPSARGVATLSSAESFPLNIAGCPGATRFVTSDAPTHNVRDNTNPWLA